MRVTMHGKRLTIGPDLREELNRRLQFALGRFSGVIRQVTVHLADVNGPRGGIDRSSRIVVQLKAAEQVVAEAIDVTVLAAFDRTCYRIKRLVARTVERRNKSASSRNVFAGFSKED